MPTSHDRFATPAPITLRLRNHAGTVEVVASDTAETTVDLSSRLDDPATVELSGDGRTLTIEPRARRFHHREVDVVVHLPAGSNVQVHTAAARVRVLGPVNDLDVGTASGQVHIDEVAGAADIATSSGSAHVGRVGGRLAFSSASGSLEVHRVGGPCKARTASGSVSVGTADDDVAAQSASGGIAVREAHRGTVDLTSMSGTVDIGVRRGTLAWLDVTTVSGRTRSDLAEDDGAAATDGHVLNVRARSVSGNVTVRPSGIAPIAL